MTLRDIYKSALVSFDLGLTEEQENSVFLLSISLFLSEVVIYKSVGKPIKTYDETYDLEYVNDNLEKIDTQSMTLEQLYELSIPNDYMSDFIMCCELYIAKVSNKNIGQMANFGALQEQVVGELQIETVRALLRKRHNCKTPIVVMGY